MQYRRMEKWTRVGHRKGGREKQREKDTKEKGQKERRTKGTKGNPGKAEKGMRSLVVALARQHIHAFSKKFDYLSGRCRRQSGGSQMLLA